MDPPRLGPRGEGWVVGQFALGAVVVAAGVVGPRWPSGWRPALAVVGALVGVRGLVLFVQGIRALGSSLTPFPRPSDRATLRERGVYARVRHPIYGGALLLALGWSVALSPVALAVTALLWRLLALKSRVEESMLLERYPGYAAYRERVRRRFLPAPF
jgi:protein-S-isoprenylcysteine O-methyltransferase Ste14